MKLIYLFYISLVASLRIQSREQLACVACGELLPQYGDNYKAFCSNPPALGSMAICLIENFKSDKYYQDFLKACSLEKSQFFFAYKNGTKYVNINNVEYPTRLSTSDVISYWTRLYTIADQMTYGIYFGSGLLAYWGVVMLIGGIFYWFNFIFPHSAKNIHGKFTNWLRRSFILAPTFSHSHAKSLKHGIFEMMIPLRMETLVIIGWVVLCIVFLLVDTINFSTSLWDMKSRVGLRAGLLVSFNVPLLILFGGRNNFTQWLTGWSQSRFILFHKWIARMLLIMLIVHASCKTHVLMYRGVYQAYIGYEYIRWGIVGIVMVGCLTAHSWMYIRNMNYEVFLILHHIFAIIFIASAWKHTVPTNCSEFYYAATVVWGADKLFRLVRITLFGVKTAKLQLIADEVIKVTVPKPSWWLSFPGAVAYIYFLKPTCFWQSHPFSIIDSALEENTLTFLVKVKGGITHGLCRQLRKSPNLTQEVKACVEGPYAQRHSGNFYDNIVMFSTGTGVSGLYQAGIDLIKHHSNKRVRFYWIIRYERSINWFLKELMMLQDTIVEPVIYITNLTDLTDSSNSKGDDSSKGDHIYKSEKECLSLNEIRTALPFVDFRCGRPNIHDLVYEEVETSQSSIAFITCGNAHFVDNARNAVRNVLKTNRSKRVELFEDFQAW
ncbi:unnamed protein product [Candida verbasci]|uniref:ferric-chelate reductase (NADPH) n=1 Tax=Candida verbasci TaxID=1227364 RepID=A0A9W4X9M5_9ASCO|nr:unnamed protein product [Candida verbasci]